MARRQKFIKVSKKSGLVKEVYLDADPAPVSPSASPPKIAKEKIMNSNTAVQRGKAHVDAVDEYFAAVDALRKLEPGLSDDELIARIDAGNPAIAAAAKDPASNADVEAYTRQQQAALADGRNPYEREWDEAILVDMRTNGGSEHTATGRLMRSRPELFNAANSQDPVQRFAHGADVELRSGRAKDLAEAYRSVKGKLPEEAVYVDQSTLFL